MKFIITNGNQKVIIFQSNIKPEVGEFLHLPHQGGYQVLKVVHHVSDDCGHSDDELMWIELICKKVEKEEEDSEIRVGDEIYILDKNYLSVVTSIYEVNGNKNAVCITQNGKWNIGPISDLHKTGRHFPEIKEVLKKMQEGKRSNKNANT